jgi:hypothetical protein
MSSYLNRSDFIRLTVQTPMSTSHRYPSSPRTLPGDKFSAIAKAIIKYHSKHPEDALEAYTIDFLET